MSLAELFDSVAKNMKNKFEYQAKILGHPGEVGTGRENVLKKILSTFIPGRYAVDSGIVLDALGRRSKQMDVVIYEAGYTPVFEVVDGKRMFPCETVTMVGQVKTEIASQKEMQEALDNIKSVKELDRSNQCKNLPITGPGVSTKEIVQFDPSKNFRDQIFGFIFCSRSISLELIISQLQEFNRNNARNLWTNLLMNYNSFLIEYVNGHLIQDPMKASDGAILQISDNPNIFAIFISLLIEFLNQAHIARPNLFDYCQLSTVRISKFPLA